MKKIISLVAILLCFATSYGQDTKPTKQETMDWIADKIKQNLSVIWFEPPNGSPFQDEYEFVSFANGIITIKETYHITDEPWITILKLNLNKINQYSNYTFNGDGVIQKISGDKSKFENKWFFVWTNDRNQTKKIIELSEELKPRFEKAVSTLIDYNNAEKPKEKF